MTDTLSDRDAGAAAPLEAGAPSASAARPRVRAISDSLVDLVHSFARAKARLLAEGGEDVEWSSRVLLRHLAHEGPMRASGLADSLQFDPSTVSRQVSALVKQGMLERQADPEDGRASLLVLTARAREVVAEHEQRRLDHFAEFLDRWDEADLDRFAELFPRFVRDFDAASAHWLSTRPTPAPDPAASDPGASDTAASDSTKTDPTSLDHAATPHTGPASTASHSPAERTSV